MSNKNEVFEYPIGQLRQQVNDSQCEDLAHEVLSLKNQLRDALERETELQKALNLLGRQIFVLANKFPHEPEKFGGPLPKAESYVVGEHGPEQSGCRKEDTRECEHVWNRYIVHPHRKICLVCGAKE